MLYINESLVAFHNKSSKIPPSKSMHFAKSCAKHAYWSSELIFAFLYAGSNMQNAYEQLVLYIQNTCANFVLHSTPHKNLTVLGLEIQTVLSW